jgi:hypothetical protein
MKEKNKIIIDTLGDTLPTDNVSTTKAVMKKTFFDNMKIKIDPAELDAIQAIVDGKLNQCSTHREVLELELNSLAECVGVATEIYKKSPIPDFAYQLAALSNAHKTALQQLEKMKDPKLIVTEIEGQIRFMFMDIIKAMAIEIDKTKKEMVRIAPDHKTTLEDLFGRMLNAIQPETQKIYDNLQTNLKKILGIRTTL